MTEGATFWSRVQWDRLQALAVMAMLVAIPASLSVANDHDKYDRLSMDVSITQRLVELMSVSVQGLEDRTSYEPMAREIEIETQRLAELRELSRKNAMLVELDSEHKKWEMIDDLESRILAITNEVLGGKEAAWAQQLEYEATSIAKTTSHTQCIGLKEGGERVARQCLTSHMKDLQADIDTDSMDIRDMLIRAMHGADT